ncbi:MAG: YkgJ family cysteine cluster protein [Acidobacteriota bacterium]|jgi:Fe-S-cluster containining protein
MPEFTEQEILENSSRMGLDTRFKFCCGPGVECFNRCCGDVAILLSPYDVLRLKNALHMDSSEFLEKYTLTMRSRDKHIPAVFLRMDDETRRCPFVTESGCAVYNHRPWACRMYPLGMAEPKGPNAAAQRFYFLVQEELCQGHRAANEHSVREWIAAQKLDDFDRMQAPFLELMSHPGWEGPEPLSQQKLDMCFMSLYDLDRFRRFISETRFLDLFEVDEARIEAIAEDDEELLDFAFDWLAFSLFHEKRMKLRRPLPANPAAVSEVEAMSNLPG